MGVLFLVLLLSPEFVFYVVWLFAVSLFVVLVFDHFKHSLIIAMNFLLLFYILPSFTDDMLFL